MSHNTFGNLLRFTTWGESHGKAIGCVVDGFPANIPIDLKYIQSKLDLRKPGQSKFTTQRKERDLVDILSGVFNGKSTGSPISMIIFNEDQRSKDYSNIQNKFRPGHADFTYHMKYKNFDYRGGGRSSARETAMRVAAGAIAKKYLKEKFGMEIRACVTQIDDIKAETFDWALVETNPFFFPDESKLAALDEKLRGIMREKDSIGAKLMVVATNVPVGLGEPIFDRLDADIAHALMGINAVKGVEIGDGFAVASQKGSEHRDELTPTGFAKNSAGGILGGISSGQDIVAHIALKPTSSIGVSGKTINKQGEACDLITKGRHDPCVGIRAVPIAEAMLALTLMDHFLRNRGQNADVICATPKI